jgi:solute carrier family 20 (sodium-dependent phosphate transporter)
MSFGSVLEFAGAVGVGNRVADTIRTKVLDVNRFTDNAPLLMLGMMCAVIASSLYLTLCTKIGLPVSTTHSIMGGVIGMGIALVGANGVIWVDTKGGISSGVIQVFLAWIIAPGLSGAFAAIIFSITKYGVMLRSNPALKGLILVPVYSGITAALLTMLVVWKGGQINVSKWSDPELIGLIIGVGAAWALLMTIFLVPWLYRLTIKNDWQLRWYHIVYGPLLLRRPEPPVQPDDARGGIKDFYEGHLTKEELDAVRGNTAPRREDDVEANAEGKKLGNEGSSEDGTSQQARPEPVEPKMLVGPRPEGPWYSGAVMFWGVKWLFLRGVDQDIIKMQKKESVLTGDLEEIHSHVQHYDNKAEYLYSFLQVMTACTASFTHGANDVANAIAPYATIYQIWSSGTLSGSKSDVPVWIL